MRGILMAFFITGVGVGLTLLNKLELLTCSL